MEKSQENPAQMKKTMWILWGALIFSMFVYMGLGLFLQSQADFKAGDSYQTIQVPLILVAILLTGFVLSFWSKILTPPHGELGAYFTPFLIRMALSESIGLYGLLLSQIGAPATYLFVFIGWGVLLQLSLAPTESSIREFRQKYGPKK
jgi:hypothetical protein